MQKDPYDILGVSRSASMEEIDQAYKNLVKKYHPDRYRDNPLRELAEEKLKEIIEAYEYIKLERNNQTSSKNNYNPYASQNSQNQYTSQNSQYTNQSTNQNTYQSYPQQNNQNPPQSNDEFCAGCCAGLSALWCLDAFCECAGSDCI